MPTQTLLHGSIDDKIKNRDLNPTQSHPYGRERLFLHAQQYLVEFLLKFFEHFRLGYQLL